MKLDLQLSIGRNYDLKRLRLPPLLVAIRLHPNEGINDYRISHQQHTRQATRQATLQPKHSFLLL